MKFIDFFFTIIKSFWAWIGLFMDIIGAIVYKSPDMVDKLSFANVVQQYWWVWIVIGTCLIILSAWKVVQKLEKDKKSYASSKKEYYHSGSGDIVDGNKNVYYREDKKKRKVLNKLDWHVKQVVNEIVLYKAYSDKEISAKKKYNEFQDFYQSNSAEASLVLEKLIEKISLEARSVISQIVIIHGMTWVRDTEIASKVPFENLSPLPKIDGIEEELENLRDKIHEEIYKELKT